MNKLYEALKVDIGLAPVSLATTNKTGEYFCLADYRKAIAILQIAGMAATKTAKIEVYEATNAEAGSAALLTGATATITANTLVASMTLTLATVLNSHTVTINGLLFTAHTDTTTVADREFSISGNDTADATELCVCINDPTYGVPGCTASSAAGVVTLISTVPGAVVFTVTETGATITLATLHAQAYIELDALSLTASFTHIAAKITTDATIVVGAVLLRGGQRKEISQKIGASASV
ncbi:MAG: hypothetical protein IMF10_04560 [Proteobacteria bacterium]|jgi:hypothetical protein|nr:hypothetical protein [Pseudomonadota bacterium]